MLKDIILDLLLSQASLGFIVGIAAIVVYRLITNRLPEKALVIIADTFQFIEDHYKEWGIFGSEKMAKLVQTFIDKFQEEYGKAPTPTQVGAAVAVAEKLVTEQKNSLTG